MEAETIASLFMNSYLGAALSITTTEKPRSMVEILAPLLDVHSSMVHRIAALSRS